ncbi:hypothetical protein WKY82_09275 [Gordonia malaquae]|uniref:hypothetical protein n=1 Tax=Gordonia malaquae TaxID=410332 RepID=UPI0030C79410
MTTAIRYEENSTIVRTDDASRLTLSEPNFQYVKVEDADGTIRLIPWSALHESERAILEDPDLYDQTHRGLENFMHGRGVSSDWLFDDDE